MAFRNGYSLIGLDLGDTSAKMVQLKFDRNGGWDIHDTARLGYGEPGGGDTPDSQKVSIRRAIRMMLKEGDFVGRKVVTVLPRQDVLVRPIRLSSDLDHNDTAGIWNAVREEAARYLPYPIEWAVLDFLTLGKSETGGELEVLLISAAEEKMQDSLSLLKSAGLHCVSMDIVPCAITRVATHILGKKYNQPVVTVEIGEQASFIGVVKQGKLLFSRCVKVGSLMLTHAIATELDISMAKAEMFKRNYGMNHRGKKRVEFLSDGRLALDDIPAAIYELCRDQLTWIAEEIVRSVDYFRNHLRGVKVDKALIFGGGALLKGLPDFLSEQSGLDVKIGDLFFSTDNSNGQSEEDMGSAGSAFAVAFGLALRNRV